MMNILAKYLFINVLCTINKPDMLNYITYIILFFSLPFHSYAQVSAVFQHHQLHALGQYKEAVVQLEAPAKTLRSSDAAKEIIHSIISSVGLKPNFEIREAKISNAAAVNYKGKRYILYDAKFIERIQNTAQTDWAAISILAHEIGHHLNGHTLLGKGNDNPALELEADEFSGFILRQMGASLEDAQKATRLMSSVRESASHPGRKARLTAIEKGYLSANERILAYANQAKVHIAASIQPKEETEKDPAVYALPQERIFKEVHLRMIPGRTFYLTHQLKLVALTEKGPAVLGNLSKNKNKLMLNIYDKKGGIRSFYVSGKGMLVDEANKVIGYIKNRT
jgi:hypothetical protein